VLRVVLVTFRTPQHLPRRLKGLEKHFSWRAFVLYSVRTRGGYDWIGVQAFPSEEMADEESDIYRDLFRDIYSNHMKYMILYQRKFFLLPFSLYTSKDYKKIWMIKWISPFLPR
jgi:hypothetical protein